MLFASSNTNTFDLNEDQVSNVVQYSGKKFGRKFPWVGPSITVGSQPEAY